MKKECKNEIVTKCHVLNGVMGSNLGILGKLNNPNFKPIEFDGFKNEAGSNYSVLSAKSGQKLQSSQ